MIRCRCGYEAEDAEDLVEHALGVTGSGNDDYDHYEMLDILGIDGEE